MSLKENDNCEKKMLKIYQFNIVLFPITLNLPNEISNEFMRFFRIPCLILNIKHVLFYYSLLAFCIFNETCT